MQKKPTSTADGAVGMGAEARTVATRPEESAGRGRVRSGEPAAVVRFGAPYGLAVALGVIALAASSTSLFIPGVLGGPLVSQGNLRGTALVLLALAVPVLFVSMYFAAKGSARALVFWLGAVAYIIYQAVLFLFGTPFNS
ncbi:MAG: hypothetical protein ACXWZG_01620, partial [Microbacterium sp.]